MKNIQAFFVQNEWLLKIIYAVLAIVVAVILYKLIVYAIEKATSSKNLLNGKKANTYVKFIRSIIRSFFIIIVFIVLLKICGVDVSSMLAGIGIIGIILGLAVQDLLKDVIRGSSILSDGYFSVGDVIRYNDIEGKVLVIGLKTTKIKELSTGNVISIANRNIEQVAVLSEYIYVRVPLPYELSIDSQRKAVDDVVKLVKADELVEDCENIGLTELAESKIEYLLKVKVDPVNKLQARRNSLEHIVQGLENNGISIPYNQIDVHQK